MAQPIEIRGRNGRLIGTVSFDESPIHLQAYRTANGFNLLLPIEVDLALVGRNDPLPMVSDLGGIIFAGLSNQKVEIGRLVWNSWHIGGRGSEESAGGSYNTNTHMTWLGFSPGTLYPLLHGLEEKGYLHSSEEGGGRQLRRVYRATTKGRKTLAGAKVKVRELFSELLDDEC